MCAENSASLEVSYGHLAEAHPLVAIWLTDVPRDMLQILDEVLQSVVLEMFPHYTKVMRGHPPWFSVLQQLFICFAKI